MQIKRSQHFKEVQIHTYTHTHTHICTYKEIYYQELAHHMMEAGKSEIHRVGWQLGEPGKLMLQLHSQGPQGETQGGWWCRQDLRAPCCRIPVCLGRLVFSC